MPAGPLADEPGRAVRPELDEPVLLALLEAQARLRAERVAERGPPDADGVEHGGFDDDVGRGVRDLRRCPAHDSGDPEDRLRVADEQRVGIELALDVVERLDALAGSRQAHDDPTVVDRRRIEGVDGLAELEHHVVAHVDDVADRALARRDQAHLDPVRRRPDRDARHVPTHEPRAQPGLQDLDGQAVRDRCPGLRRLGVREADGGARDGGDLAGQADHAQRVAAVGFDVDIEHDIAVELGQWHAERGVRREDEDAVGVAGQAQFVARAQHPVADDAHLLGALDAPVARQDRSRQSDRDALARGDVGGPAHDLEDLARTERHRGQREPVGPGMLLDGQQLAGHDVLPVRAPALDALDLHPEQGQPLGELFGRQVQVDVVGQPGQRHSHRNCSRNRRSFSMYRRRSPTLWRRLAMRSTPIPNAKPWYRSGSRPPY